MSDDLRSLFGRTFLGGALTLDRCGFGDPSKLFCFICKTPQPFRMTDNFSLCPECCAKTEEAHRFGPHLSAYPDGDQCLYCGIRTAEAEAK